MTGLERYTPMNIMEQLQRRSGLALRNALGITRLEAEIVRLNELREADNEALDAQFADLKDEMPSQRDIEREISDGIEGAMDDVNNTIDRLEDRVTELEKMAENVDSMDYILARADGRIELIEAVLIGSSLDQFLARLFLQERVATLLKTYRDAGFEQEYQDNGAVAEFERFAPEGVKRA